MTAAPDDDRNMALAEAVADITEYIRSRLAVYAQTTGNTADFHLIALDGDQFEVSAEVTDHDMMCDAFMEQVDRWITSGHVAVTDSDDGPLFTATFGPTKARLQ